MDIDFDVLLENMVRVYGVELKTFKAPYEEEDLHAFDDGFRDRWFEKDPYQYLRRQLETAEEKTLYETKSPFGDAWFCFCRPEKEGRTLVGPFLTEAESVLVKRMQDLGQLTVMQMDSVRSYLRTLPAPEEDLLRGTLETLLSFAWQGTPAAVNNEEGLLDFAEPVRENVLQDDTVSMRKIEERYAVEDAMLSAVSEGNYEKALEVQSAFRKYPVRERYNMSLQQNWTALLTLNTLCRRAVQNAAVHPAHIDHVSSGFASRILTCRTSGELVSLYNEMIHTYCMMVRTYSLKGYSRTVQDAINYIDFNLSDPLSLSLVAEEISVDRKYLSSQFRKETGKTMTDYIQEKRIQKTLRYLSVTSLPVGDIAEKAGILDVNYFSRIFRKQIGMTPTQYRHMVQGKQSSTTES